MRIMSAPKGHRSLTHKQVVQAVDKMFDARRTTQGYQPSVVGVDPEVPPSGGSSANRTVNPAVFREGTKKKGGMNPDPDPNYRPPKPQSFKVSTTPRQLPLTPSADPDERRLQLENALAWCLEMLGGLGIGYEPGEALLRHDCY